jgi:hypothetical protein
MNSNEFFEQDDNLITNDFKTTNMISSQEFSFNFTNSKFLWKELMKINTNYIERSGDVSVLSPYVQNILSSRLNIDNIDLLSEEYIIQLITLLQLTGQYLAYVQKRLEIENDELKEKINYLKSNLTDNEKYQNIIENLNRQNKEKDYMIKTYQNMIQSGNSMKEINQNKNMNNNLQSDPEIHNIKKTYYYCSICTGKKFKTQKYLDEHMERRHYNQKKIIMKESEEKEEEKSQEINYRIEFEKKLKKMREDIEIEIKQKEEMNDFALLNNKLESLKEQILLLNNNNNSGDNNKNIISNQNNKIYQKHFNTKENREIINLDYKKKYEEYKKKCEDLNKTNKEQSQILQDLKKTNKEQSQMLQELKKETAKLVSNKSENINIYNDKSNSNSKTKKVENTTITSRNQSKHNTMDKINSQDKDKEKNRESSENYNNNERKPIPIGDFHDIVQNKFLDNNNIKTSKVFTNNESMTPMGNEPFNSQENEAQNKINEKKDDFNNNKNVINEIPVQKKNELKTSQNQEDLNMASYSIIQSKNLNMNNDDNLKTKQNIFNNEKIDNKENKKMFSESTLKDIENDGGINEFYVKFDKRNKNYKDDKGYNIDDVPEKFKHTDSKIIYEKIGELKNSKNSIDSDYIKELEKKNKIYEEKNYYKKIEEVLGLQKILDSYNNYMKEKNQNSHQMIEQYSRMDSKINNSQNLRPSNQSYQLRASQNGLDDQKNKNPFKDKVVKKSITKGINTINGDINDIINSRTDNK